MKFLPDILTFLTRHFGYTVEQVDLEGREFLVRGRDITEAEMIAAIAKYADAVSHHVANERSRRMHVCVGGPHAGQKHFRPTWSVICFRDGPADWSAYRVGRDGRAWYCGQATSEAKARRKALSQEVRERLT